jgi:hypothetical protein
MEKIPYGIRKLSLKAQSKGEVYSIITTKGGCYLPPQKETTIKFIREIVTGEKKVILITFLFDLFEGFDEQRSQSLPNSPNKWTQSC